MVSRHKASSPHEPCQNWIPDRIWSQVLILPMTSLMPDWSFFWYACKAAYKRCASATLLRRMPRHAARQRVCRAAVHTPAHASRMRHTYVRMCTARAVRVACAARRRACAVWQGVCGSVWRARAAKRARKGSKRTAMTGRWWLRKLIYRGIEHDRWY